MERARASLLGASDSVGLKAEQLENGRHGDGRADGSEVDRRAWGSAWRGLLLLLVLSEPQLFASFASLGELAVAVGVDLLVAACHLVLGSDIADGAVQADVVIVLDVIEDDAAGVIKGQGHLDANRFALEGFVPAFDFAVGLGVVGRGLDMGHAGDADELLKVLGDELGTVIADDAGIFTGELFTSALQNGRHVLILHFFADFPVDGATAEAVEDGTKEVKGAGDVEVTDINVPMFVGLRGLVEASAFLGDVGGGAGEQMVGLEDAVDAGGTAGDDIGVEHHERQSSVTFEGVQAGEDTDAFFFVIGQPMVAWHPGVVLVYLAEAMDPVMVFAGGDVDPGEEATDGNLRLVAPVADKVDELIARVVRNPATL